MEPLFLFRPDHADTRADTKGVPMPTAPLPENPSLEHLKNQAKLVRDLIRSGDDGALSMVDEFHPRRDAASMTEADRVGFKTADAQLIVARMYGFTSWARLRDHLGIISASSFTPFPDPRSESHGPTSSSRKTHRSPRIHSLRWQPLATMWACGWRSTKHPTW